MTQKEQEALFQSILDDENLLSKTPEKDLEELIDDFIKIYEKTGKLVSKFCKYYNFSKSFQESDNENNVEDIMQSLENQIRINSDFINSLTIRITNQINEGRRGWGINSDGTSKKQRFVNALQTAKTDIDRMSGILNSINILIRSRNDLLNTLNINGLLNDDEVRRLS